MTILRNPSKIREIIVFVIEGCYYSNIGNKRQPAIPIKNAPRGLTGIPTAGRKILRAITNKIH